MNEDWIEKVRLFLEKQVRSNVSISRPNVLTGGAIQENWSIDVTIKDGDWSGFHKFVVRLDSKSSVKASHSRIEEYNLIKTAYDAGVLVPKPLFCCDDEQFLGCAFFVMERLNGLSAGHKLVKENENPTLLFQLGENLARLHSIKPSSDKLPFLQKCSGTTFQTAITLYREYLDLLQVPHPVIELGLVWLESNFPANDEVVLCHRDFRTGNFMVNDGELSGILDWEMAGWSNPHEDIFWFTSKCWRFGMKSRPAGGLGQRDDFYRGYELTSNRKIEHEQKRFWEVMAHVRWALIACQQANRHVLGFESSIELALTAHVVPQLEFEILNLIKED